MTLRFLADMGVSWRVVEWLRAAGHDAMHLREEGLDRLPDGEIFVKATAERRIVLTFDLDFGEIIALSAGATTSVILFRLNNTTSPFVIQRLDAVLSHAAPLLQSGVIVVVEDARHRIRRLPLGT